jgi:hypothetical protein
MMSNVYSCLLGYFPCRKFFYHGPEKTAASLVVYIVAQKSRDSSDKFSPISYFDHSGHFRGPAIFEQKKEAIAYALKYKYKMMEYALKKMNEGNYSFIGNKTNLYIIEEDKLPPLIQYSNYLNIKI